ncbi:MAG: carboxypeptidase-like regulatory domain-containing protein, partial [Gemmatimonadota bacterium]
GAVGEGWAVEAQVDTVVSRTLPVPSDGIVDTLYVPWSEPITLVGVVRAGATGEGVEGATVSVENRFVRAITDGSGRFRLRGLGAGPVILTTTYIGYAPRVDTILAESGTHLSLEIRLGAEAIELEPLVVTATGTPSLWMRGTRELGMTREEVDEALPRSIDFIQMLRRANVPGLLVSPAGGSAGFCIEFLRSSGGCAMLQVFVNGLRISDPAEFVANLDPSSVAEFIVLRPVFAQFQYVGPLVHNGVLDITLR